MIEANASIQPGHALGLAFTLLHCQWLGVEAQFGT
jgi:hypothetical protein